MSEDDFDGRRYDSSGGYEIVYSTKEIWEQLNKKLIQQTIDELERYLSDKKTDGYPSLEE